MKKLKEFLQNIHVLELIKIRYDYINGFIISILDIEYQGVNNGFNGALFSIYIINKNIAINLFFIYFEIQSPFYFNSKK